jgi:hypothetical protein
MKSIIRLLSLFLPIMLSTLCHAEEASNVKKKTFPEWAFCMVYQVRDPDKREARDGLGDPLSEDGKSIPRDLIHGARIIDVAALTSRMVKSCMLKREQAEAAIRDTTQSDKRYPISDCYDPHHIFVFYGAFGNPVAAIEICFQCKRVLMTPEIRANEGQVDRCETADLASLAKIVSEAGLELTSYKSLEAYLGQLEQRKHPQPMMESKSELDAN